MATVTTIFQPDTPQEMPDEEVAVMRAQGFLIEDPTPAPAQASTSPGATVTAPAGAATATTSAKEASPDGGKQGQ